MPDQEGTLLSGFQSSLFFETPEEIYARVFRELKPRTAVPELQVEFCRFANADSFIRLEDGRLRVRISDLLAAAPAPVMEALAYILLGKLYRKPIARIFNHRYRLYLNRRDMRRQAHLIRQIRGRKFLSGPKGAVHHLEEIFERLNQQFFDGLLGMPRLGWSRGVSRSMLGHFDPSHNAIIISRIFDRQNIRRMALEFVMYHEMLHLRHPTEYRGARRCIHTPEFKRSEKQFDGWKEASELLKRL
jgi:hypothetical protein